MKVMRNEIYAKWILGLNKIYIKLLCQMIYDNQILLFTFLSNKTYVNRNIRQGIFMWNKSQINCSYTLNGNYAKWFLCQIKYMLN